MLSETVKKFKNKKANCCLSTRQGELPLCGKVNCHETARETTLEYNRSYSGVKNPLADKINLFNLSIICCSIIIMSSFTGCSFKQKINYDEYTSVEAAKDINDSSNNLKNNLLSQIDEKKVRKQQIILDSSKNISDILNELDTMYGITYILSNPILDFPLKKSSYIIYNYEDLANYVKETSNYKLEVSNPFYNNKITKISIVEKNIEEKRKFDKMTFQLPKQNISLKSIMETIQEQTGYNFIIKDVSSDFASLFLNGKYISFKGNGVSNFLNYLKEVADLEISIDYDKKNILISSYRIETFKISMPPADDGSTTATTGTTSTAGGAPAPTGGSTSTSSGALSELESSLRKIINDSTSSNGIAPGGMPTPNNINNNISNIDLTYTIGKEFLQINKEAGEIIIRTSPAKMEMARKIINEFQDSFNKKIKITVSVIEILLNKNYNYGLNFHKDITGKTASFEGISLGSVASVGNVASVTNSVINMVGSDKGVSVQSASTMGTIVDSKRHDFFTLNNTAIQHKDESEASYIASTTVTTTPTTTGNPTTSTAQTIGKYPESTTVSVSPRISGNEISLNVSSTFKKTSLKTVKSGGNDITTPTTSTQNFSNKYKIKSGEKIILGGILATKSGNDYSGIVPIENFIIGGGTVNSFVRTETVMIIEAKIID